MCCQLWLVKINLKAIHRRDAEAQREAMFIVNSAAGAVNNKKLSVSAVKSFYV